MENWLLDTIVAYVLWVVYLVANTIFTSIRNMFWACNGTHRRLLQNRFDENYEECAQVLTVLWKHRLDIFLESNLNDYVLVHEKFVHPEYVLSDNITLLQITESQAIFAQEKPGAEPAHTFNFLILGQYFAAEKIITMPLNQFHRLADNMKGDGGRVILLQNQSRCGGSLFASIFLETKRCIMLNEPHVLNAFCKFYHMERVWSKEEGTRIFRSVIRMLCKPYRGLGKPPLLYVIKPTATCIIGCDDFQEMMPEIQQLFIYRDPKQVAISLRRLAATLQTLRLVFNVPVIPNMVAPAFRFAGLVSNDFKGWTPKYSNELEIGYMIAAITMYHYLRCMRAGIPIPAIKYEDLVKHPEAIIRKMFRECKLSDDLVPLGLEAMKKDSQEQTPFSREKLKKLIPNPPTITPTFLDAARGISERFNVPGPDNWEGFRLEGSILAE